ncbi:MAG: hypothetical protein MHPSP_003650, partial [Paramarteilia canceri]
AYQPFFLPTTSDKDKQFKPEHRIVYVKRKPKRKTIKLFRIIGKIFNLSTMSYIDSVQEGFVAIGHARMLDPGR